jgi:hypothetical protein
MNNMCFWIDLWSFGAGKCETFNNGERKIIVKKLDILRKKTSQFNTSHNNYSKKQCRH